MTKVESVAILLSPMLWASKLKGKEVERIGKIEPEPEGNSNL